MRIINSELFRPRNIIVIGLIAVLARFAFAKAINAIDGKR